MMFIMYYAEVHCNYAVHNCNQIWPQRLCTTYFQESSDQFASISVVPETFLWGDQPFKSWGLGNASLMTPHCKIWRDSTAPGISLVRMSWCGSSVSTAWRDGAKKFSISTFGATPPFTIPLLHPWCTQHCWSPGQARASWGMFQGQLKL